MQRVPEPELMNEPAQVQAYAEADFEDAHGSFIVHLLRAVPPSSVAGCALDLGCGPGDITFRLAHAYPNLNVHGMDAAPRMLDWGRARAIGEHLDHRIAFFLAYLTHEVVLPCNRYQLLVSNSLLHHLAHPSTLWEVLKRMGEPGAPWFVMDLLRPERAEDARNLVCQYAGDAPDILQTDFYNSLLAAYRPDEVKDQLFHAGHFGATVETVSDRHWIAYGRC